MTMCITVYDTSGCTTAAASQPIRNARGYACSSAWLAGLRLRSLRAVSASALVSREKVSDSRQNCCAATAVQGGWSAGGHSRGERTGGCWVTPLFRRVLALRVPNAPGCCDCLIALGTQPKLGLRNHPSDPITYCVARPSSQLFAPRQRPTAAMMPAEAKPSPTSLGRARARAVHRSWEAMSVVHFVLAFRDLIGAREEHMLHDLPERAVCHGCDIEEHEEGGDPSQAQNLVPSVHDETEKETQADSQHDTSDDPAEGHAGEDSADMPSPSGRRSARIRSRAVTDRKEEKSEVALHELTEDDLSAMEVELLTTLIKFLAAPGARKSTVQRLHDNVLAKTILSERAQLLKELCEDAAERQSVRDAISNGKSNTRCGSRLVPGGVDRDRSISYTHVRGLDGCASSRMEIAPLLPKPRSMARTKGKSSRKLKTGKGPVRADDTTFCSRSMTAHVVTTERIEAVIEETKRAPKNNMLQLSNTACTKWLADTLKRARAREREIRVEADAAREANCVVINGTVVNLDDFGRGRRKRPAVEYGERTFQDDDADDISGDVSSDDASMDAMSEDDSASESDVGSDGYADEHGDGHADSGREQSGLPSRKRRRIDDEDFAPEDAGEGLGDGVDSSDAEEEEDDDDDIEKFARSAQSGDRAAPCVAELEDLRAYTPAGLGPRRARPASGGRATAGLDVSLPRAATAPAAMASS